MGSVHFWRVKASWSDFRINVIPQGRKTRMDWFGNLGWQEMLQVQSEIKRKHVSGLGRCSNPGSLRNVREAGRHLSRGFRRTYRDQEISLVGKMKGNPKVLYI